MDYRADLHVHIGSTRASRPVKIGASRLLTLDSIVDRAEEAGIGLIGVVDFVPEVIEEAREDLRQHRSVESPGGGLIYGNTTIVPGFEVDIRPPGHKPAHFVCFMPEFSNLAKMGEWLSRHQRNPSLSSQRTYCSADDLKEQCQKLGGTFWPAHAFTPHKGFYGAQATSYQDVFSCGSGFAALELGLSADTHMAERLAETIKTTYVSASDAHGRASIGREYMVLKGSPSFETLVRCLPWGLAAEGLIVENHGLDPRLGKYYRSSCPRCQWVARGTTGVAAECASCGHSNLILGVKERIEMLAREHGRDPGEKPAAARPPYLYEVPLEFIPGVSGEKMRQLQKRVPRGTPLHQAPLNLIYSVMGGAVASYVKSAREGTASVSEGGGGQYGRVIGEQAETV